MLAESKVCRHHWVLDPGGDGVWSRGVCKLCGAEKLFNNVTPQPMGYNGKPFGPKDLGS